MASITYHEFQPQDFDPLLAMGIKLWKDFSREELQKLIEQTLTSGRWKILMARNANKHPIGFAIVSIRVDHVEGAEQSPTGYLEGIYVEPEYRKQGVARKLVELSEDWLKENHCTQMGSDTWLTDTRSRNFHKKIGFWEEEEVVHFLKNL